MNFSQKILRTIVTICTLCAVLVGATIPKATLAASILSPSVGLSDVHNIATGVTYTITFTTGSTDTLKQMDFQFATTNSNTTKPASLNLTSSTLGTSTGFNGSWTIDTTDASTGLLHLVNTTGESIAASTTISAVFSGITNPEIADCDSATTTLSDTCWIRIKTFNDAGITTVDSGNVPFTITEDPSMSFQVENVVTGETHNGITSTLDSTSDSIAFGHLQIGTVEYAIQKLTIQTNAPHGYVVNAYLPTGITGANSSSDVISPFGAVNATWSTPQSWASPFGTTPNSNTGWIGANTSDGRVSGWYGQSNKFGPLSTTPHTVAYSSGADRTGTVVYVAYAIEVNGYQPSDYYTGEISYDVQAKY